MLCRFGVGEFDWAEFTQRLKQKTYEEIDAYVVSFSYRSQTLVVNYSLVWYVNGS